MDRANGTTAAGLVRLLSTTTGMRRLAIASACLLVAGVASIGQVDSRDTSAADEFVAGPAGPAAPGASTTATLPGGAPAPVAPGATLPGGAPAPGATTGATLPGGAPDPAAPATTLAPGATVPPFDYGMRTQGVTDDEVVLGLSYNTTGCGDAGLLQAMVGAATAGDIGRAIDAFTRYVNDGGGIGGRTLRIVIADDGGGGCPEKALSAARQLVDDEHVFAVIPGLHEVSDYAAANGVPTFIGRDDPETLQRFGANGIGLTQDITRNNRAWATFGRYYLRSDQHTPCLVHPEAGVSGDWPVYADIMRQEMAAVGLEFAVEVVYTEDVSTAQQQTSAAVARLKARGCDQVYFMAGNPLALIFFTQAAENALWRPTWTFTSYMALADADLAGHLMNQNQWENAVGLSTRVPPGEHPMEGNCADIYDTYYEGDGQSGSAAVQLACAMLLPAAEMMRRGEALTGRLDSNALVVGADAITNDFYFDSHVPLDWQMPPGGPYKTKGFTHYTVADWNSARGTYEFPQYPLYWEAFGPDLSNGVDLRPLWAGQ
jgi:ABC-type branched-subunit amino acid transport system substrate-binding protein